MVKKNKIMTYIKAHNMDELHEMTTILHLHYLFLNHINIGCMVVHKINDHDGLMSFVATHGKKTSSQCI
jgi:hypothetical protein